MDRHTRAGTADETTSCVSPFSLKHFLEDHNTLAYGPWCLIVLTAYGFEVILDAFYTLPTGPMPSGFFEVREISQKKKERQ